MYYTTNAIVLRQAEFGESSRMLTMFSSDYGLISVSARGVRRQTCKYRAASQIFCYSAVELYKKNRQSDVYTLTGATVIESFYQISADLDAYYAAGHMAAVLLRVIQPSLPDEETLRLMLNSLYLLANRKRDIRFVQAVFLLRLASEQGLMPSPDAESLKYIARNISDGCIRAIAHITETEQSELFKFRVTDDVLEEMERVASVLEKEFQ